MGQRAALDRQLPLIIDLLRRIAAENDTAILMATHSLEAAAISNRIVRMRDGQVEEAVPLTTALH